MYQVNSCWKKLLRGNFFKNTDNDNSYFTAMTRYSVYNDKIPVLNGKLFFISFALLMTNKDGANKEKAQKRPTRNKMSTTGRLTNLSNVENPFWAGALV